MIATNTVTERMTKTTRTLSPASPSSVRSRCSSTPTRNRSRRSHSSCSALLSGRCQQHHYGSHRSKDCDRHDNYLPSLHGARPQWGSKRISPSCAPRAFARLSLGSFPLHRRLQLDAGQNDHVMAAMTLEQLPIFVAVDERRHVALGARDLELTRALRSRAREHVFDEAFRLGGTAYSCSHRTSPGPNTGLIRRARLSQGAGSSENMAP